MQRLTKSLGFAAAVAVALVACKQGRGDRCQVDSDCGSHLICNKATNTCQATTGGGDIDATVPDASPDAPVDAKVDPPTSVPK